MATEPNISVETLRQLLHYNPDTGVLSWRIRPVSLCKDERAWKIWNARYAGREALTANSNGARQGNIFGRRVYAHRAAYALHYGAWPKDVIDHINGNPADNRIANLRAVDQRTNMLNQKERCTNTSGATGVTLFSRNQKWRAQITVNGRNKALGYFTDFDEAVKARRLAEVRFGFHPNHGRKV